MGVYDTVVDNAVTFAGPTPIKVADQIESRRGYGFRPLIGFGSGNCPMNSCESKQISINGAMWSSLSSNLYNRSLEKCYVPDAQMQRSCSTCGGTGNIGDSTPLSGHCLGIYDGLTVGPVSHGDGGDLTNALAVAVFPGSGAGGIANIVTAGFKPLEGATIDSGLNCRLNNFIDQIIKVTDVGVASKTYQIEVKFGLDGSVFNSQWGASGLSRADPRLRMALGLPSVNSGSVTLQFKDLLKTLIRRYGRPNSVGAANVRALGVGALAGDVTVEFDTSKKAQLRLTYIRLPSYSSYPDHAALTVYRREIRRPNGSRTEGSFGTKEFSGGLWGGG